MAKKMPMVAIVGRMNVGKSTLFNRLSRDVKSITLDYEGVTRDIQKDCVEWQGVAFSLVDTGGMSLRKREDKLLEQVRKKALDSIDESDVVLFMVDGKVGVLPEDEEIACFLREKHKKTILLVNKSDAKITLENQYTFYELYHNELVLISAEHGLGINDLLNTLVGFLPARGKKDDIKPLYKVVFVGRPNVGKSSLMNALLDQERSLVADLPGTTRESISENISFYQEHLQITDTAGIRRKSAVEEDLECLMVKNSFQALKGSDIVVLIVDPLEPRLVDQELKLAFYAFEEHYKALIILINKSDLFDESKEAQFEVNFDEYDHLIKRIETMKISCKTGKNVGRVLSLVKKVWDRHSQQLPMEDVAQLFFARLERAPLMRSGKRLELRRVKQLATAPITIGLQVNFPDLFESSQLKFFENLLRDEYDLRGVPVKFIVRKKL